MISKYLFASAALGMVASADVEITGYIYADNWFEFYFNGKKIHTDPLTFTPHNACEVKFTWDGTSDKIFAFKASDYASDSGYEYTKSTKGAQLGDGAFIAWFSDGTVTTKDWKVFTTSFGPTDASKTAGCSATNLTPCALKTTAEPTDWSTAAFDHSAWSSVTTYTESQAGWGRTPKWSNGVCSQSTSPITMENLNFYAGNVDSSGTATEVKVAEGDCLNPKTVLSDKGATFIWGSDLERDNTILIRHNAGNKNTVYVAAEHAQSLKTVSAIFLSSIALISIY